MDASSMIDGYDVRGTVGVCDERKVTVYAML